MKRWWNWLSKMGFVADAELPWGKSSLPAAIAGSQSCEDVTTHNSDTCWWCQRGLRLVECAQIGSHV